MADRERPSGEEKRKRLSDPAVRRWYDNLARGSEITATNYLRCVGGVARRTGKSLGELAKLSEADAYKLLLDFVSAEEKRGIAGSAIHTYVKSARSWLAFNGVHVRGTVKVKGAQQTPTLKDEQVPTPEDVRKILLAATTQQRAAVALIAFSGVRLEVIGNYRGTDGLRVRDLPDLRVAGGKATFASLPARVVVREELSKTGRPYFSWIGAEGASYISAYLEERIRGGEKIGPESDVIHPATAGKMFIRSKKASESVRNAIDRAGFDFRPYNLRCYFDTQLLLAESKGKLAHDFRVFWMGHTGSMEARYTTNKGRLPKELVAEMREAYRRSERFLSTKPTDPGRDVGMLSLLLQTLGVPESEVSQVDLEDATPDQLKELARKYLGQSADARQRVVSNGEIPKLLGEGWTFVAALEAGQAVLRPPGGP